MFSRLPVICGLLLTMLPPRTERIIGPAPLDADRESAKGNGCDVVARAGALEARAKAGELAVSRGGKQIGQLRVSAGPSAAGGGFPIESLAWSTSGQRLLVATPWLRAAAPA